MNTTIKVGQVLVLSAAMFAIGQGPAAAKDMSSAGLPDCRSVSFKFEVGEPVPDCRIAGLPDKPRGAEGPIRDLDMESPADARMRWEQEQARLNQFGATYTP